MRETGYAKINLALHIRAREADGYHRIETLFAFCEDGDTLEATPSDTLHLETSGPMGADLAAEPDNLVLRAARLLQGEAGVAAGASLRLTKTLPVAAGLGGGSADAAAALRLLDRVWELGLAQVRLERLAAALGADVPACIGSVAVRGEGRGDRLRPVADPGLAGTPVLLVNPRVPLSTPAVFRLWDGRDRGALSDQWIDARNDLEPMALALAPVVGDVLEVLRGQPETRLVRMSGSGATCFALFESGAARDAAAAAIGAAQPGWWILPTRLR